MGKLPIPLNLTSEYRAIQKDDLPTAVSGLKEKHRLRIQDLNKRLLEMTSVLKETHTLLKQIQVQVENHPGNY